MVSETWEKRILQKKFGRGIKGLGKTGVETIELVTGIEGGDLESDLKTAQMLVDLIKEYYELVEQAFRSTHHTSLSMQKETQKRILYELAERIYTANNVEEPDIKLFTRMLQSLIRYLPSLRLPSSPLWDDFLRTTSEWQSEAKTALEHHVNSAWGTQEP